ncbi:MAG: 6-phosphogluconolactonase, partial [Actinomycetota bacterium]|nr:6-phosphogluconolactonase [Actinomycetota bacterium]
RGRAHVALTGGETPRRAYELLAEAVEDWSGAGLWFGDERAVPPADPASNYRMVEETLLARAAIPAGQVHRVRGELGAEAAAALYAAELRRGLPLAAERVPVLDLVLLGVGEDGHVASLFPHHPALETRGRACVAVLDAPKPPPERVTLTLDVLQAAREVVVLATGEGKRAAVTAALGGPDPGTPASLVGDGRVEFVVDRMAAPTGAPTADAGV